MGEVSKRANRRAKWKGLIEQWEQSGLSLAKFAAMHNVGQSTLSRYKALFGRKLSEDQGTEETPPLLLPVIPTDSNPAQLPLEIVLRNGCVLRCNVHDHPTILTHLLRALESL